jgi:hypothetical protein
MIIPFLFVTCSLVSLLLVFFQCTYKKFIYIYIYILIGRFTAHADPDHWNCPICQNQVESQHHLFLECPFAKIIWSSQKWPLDTSVFTDITISSWIRILLRPNALLGIPLNEVFEFQLTAVIVLDQIWFAPVINLFTITRFQ